MKQHLAVWDGGKLVFSLFNKHLVVVDTQMSKLEAFLKKSQFLMVQDPVMEDEMVIVDLRLFKGMLVANHFNAIKIFDYQTMNITCNLGLPEGCSAMNFTVVDSVANEVRVVRKLANKLNIFKFNLDPKSKLFVPDSESITLDETHVI